MSQPDQHRPMDHTTENGADEAAARAVVRHHSQLAAGLDERVEALLYLVDNEYLIKAEAARQDLLGYLRQELLPHAQAEESALYPAAATDPEGRLLIEGMLAEHRALIALVTELSGAGSLVRAAAAGRGLGALFATHLAKENDLVLPLLVAAPRVSLAEVLAGMHELLGADATAPPDACGCGDCGCGGDGPDASAAVPLLTIDAAHV